MTADDWDAYFAELQAHMNASALRFEAELVLLRQRLEVQGADDIDGLIGWARGEFQRRLMEGIAAKLSGKDMNPQQRVCGPQLH